MAGQAAKDLKLMTPEELLLEERGEGQTLFDKILGRRTPRQEAASEELKRRKQSPAAGGVRG